MYTYIYIHIHKYIDRWIRRESGLTLSVPHLERDGVEDALPLAALEPSLADCERREERS